MALYSLLNMEQNKRLELSLPVWKTGVLTINTNSANWSWRKDLNLQLIAYKAITLPLELRQHIKRFFSKLFDNRKLRSTKKCSDYSISPSKRYFFFKVVISRHEIV